MTDIAAGVAAQVALTQQAIALSVIKQSVDLQQAAAEALLQSVANVPVSGTLGTNVNITA